MKNWQYSGESASSSSNLSALAPPFTVVVCPFSSNPNSNPYEPLLGLPSSSSQSTWMNPSPLLSASTWGTSLPCREFDVMNYPVEHEYSTQPVVPAAAYYGQFSDGPRSNVDEVTPYYPQYYSSRVETEKPSVFSNQPRFDGLCDDKNQLAVHVGETCGDTAGREQQHEPVKLGVDYSTEQGSAADYYSYMSLGAASHPPIGFGIHGETSGDVNLSEGGKHDGPKGQGAVDAKSRPNNPGFTGITSPTTLNMKYTPVLSSAHSAALSLDLFPGLRKDQMKHNHTIQSCMKRSGSNPGDQNFVDFFSAPSTRPQASAPVFEVHPSNHGNGSISPSEHFRADTLHSGKESHVAENSVFDEVPIWFGKSKGEERNTEEVVPNDSSIDLNRGNPGLEFPCINGYSSSLDTFNHSYQTIDSQCWKRVPTGHFAPSLGPSDFIPGKHPMESKEFDGSKISSQRLNQATFGSEYQSPERNSMFHQNQPCPLISSAAKLSSGNTMEAASLNIRPHNAHFDEFTGDGSFEASQAKQNSSEHDVNSQERKLSGHEGSDKGRNISDDSNNGFSDVSFRCVEQVLSSPPSTREATKRTVWYREEVTPKIDVSAVVRMMHNLSELLMVCSSNGDCDLKEQDCEFLKNVTNNLMVFCLENRHLSNGRNSKEPKVTFIPEGVFLGEFPGVHATLVEVKNGLGKPSLLPPFVGCEKRHRVFPSYPAQMISDFPIVTGQSSVITDDKITQSGMAEGRESSGNSGKADALKNPEKNSCAPDHPCEPSSDHSSLSDLPSNVKDDKMTQAIKTILSENFHEDEESEPQVQLFKNLWLEAEAALCSMNYRARYDRVKFEMEKSKSHNENGPSQNTVAMKDLSGSKVLANLSTENKSSDNAPKNHENLDISGQSFCGVNDVMARFNILKDRDNKSNLGSGLDGEELMSPKVSSDLKKADELPSETSKSQATISSVKGSTHGADNMESAFLSRLSILKQREENFSVVSPEPDLSRDISGRSLSVQGNSMDAAAWGNWFSMLKQQDDHLSPSELEAEKPPEAVDLESSVLARLSILLRRDDNLRSMGQDCSPVDVVNLESVVQKDYFPSTVEKVDTPKDFSSGGPENPTAGCVCDFSSSSDWEHVLKEDV